MMATVHGATTSGSSGWQQRHARGTWVRAGVVCVLLAVVTGAPAAAQSGDYVLGPGDVLAITVWDQLDLSGKFTIDPQGGFAFPIVGTFKAAGRTARDVETEMKERLRAERIFTDPQITVVVDTYSSQRVFIVGEVRSAGSYPLRGETTLLEALAQAGSASPEAASEVVIVRPPGGGQRARAVLPAEAPDAEMIRVDLALLQRGDLSRNVVLQNGDTIFVPRAENFFVFGQVRSPGQYVARRGTTVMQALSLAGGITDRGALNRVRVVRIVDGKKKEFKVKLTDEVLPGDTIVVPQRFY